MKFDLQPVQTRILMPIKSTGSAQKMQPGQLKSIQEAEESSDKQMLALPPSEDLKAPSRTVVALPSSTLQQMSIQTKEMDNRSPAKMADADTNPRDYNELMD